jgi:anti-sigma factor RsiW
MTTCAMPFDTLSAYVDGELEAHEELEARRHLDGCERCRDIVGTLITLNEACAAATEFRPVPHGLRERLPMQAPPQGRRRNRALIWIPLTAAALLAAVVYARLTFLMPARRVRGAAQMAAAYRLKPSAAAGFEDARDKVSTPAAAGLYLEDLFRSDQSALDLWLVRDPGSAND